MIRANNQGLIGTASILVSFTSENITANITITLIKATSALSISALPFPNFVGSTQSQAVNLRQIAFAIPTLIQKASLSVTMGMTSGATIIMPSSSVGFSIYKSNTSTVSTLASVVNGIIIPTVPGNGTIDIVAFAFALTSPRLSFKLNVDSPVNITSMSVSFITTQTGVQGTTNYPSVNAIFSDGTQQANIVSGGVVNIAGLLTFSSSQPAISAINSTTGMATLWGNYFSTVTMTASAVGTVVKATANYSCNLTPNIGDVDLGGSTGAPLSPQKVGTSFTVPIVANIGANYLAAIQMTITYNSSLLLVTGVSQGSGWPGGIFLSTYNSPPGSILIGGTPSLPTGSVIIAVIQFTVLGGTGQIAVISGVLSTFSNSLGSPIVSVPRPFIAGSVSMQIPSSRRRSAAIFTSILDSKPDTTPATSISSTRKRRGTCTNPPLGDANGDCLFDLNDSVFTQTYVAQKLVNSSYGSNFTAAQMIALDADQNGIIDNNDGYLLARVALQLLNFVSMPFVIPVDNLGSQCYLTIAVNVLSASQSPVKTQTYIYFDIESTNSSLTAMFSNTSFIAGSAVNVSKGAGYRGGFWLATAMGNGTYYVNVSTSLSMSNIGLSVVQATVDGYNATTANRFVFLTNSGTPYSFSDALNVNLTVGNGTATINAPSGYSPWTTFTNLQTTSACIISQTCNPGCINGTSIVVGVCNRTSQTSCQTCILCLPGSYMVSDCYNSVDRVCSACNGVSNYQNLTNQPSCATVSTCTAGQQQNTAPTTSSDRVCTPCTLGSTFKASPGQSTSCVNVSHCQPGLMQVSAPTLTSDRTCTSCTLGATYQPLVDQSSCIATTTCPAGEQQQTAATLTSDRTCISCILNSTYKALAGQSQTCISLTNCSAGQLETTAPTVSSDRICTNCPAGTTNIIGDPLSSCTPCYAGSYMAAGSSGPCVPCSAGTTDADSNSATSCVSCSRGTFVPSNKTGLCSSFNCSAGTSDVDSNPATACQNCTYGDYAPIGSYGSCLALVCAAGTTDDDFDPSTPCIACPGGTFVPPGSAGACIYYLCPSGAADTDNSSATACQQCSSGTYVPAGSIGLCSLYKCPAGQSDTDSDPTTMCISCQSGTYEPVGSFGACSNFNCTAGTIDSDSNSSTSCIPCSPGVYVPSGWYGQCSQGTCSAGTTDDDSNAATPCKQCSIGQYTPQGSIGSCSGFACAAGFIDDDSNPSTVCVKCGPGTYVPSGKYGNCTLFECLAGATDLDSNSSTPCSSCSLGTYTSVGSIGVCPSCLAGSTDNDTNPATPCVNCSAGVYAPTGSYGLCSAFMCAPGTVDADLNPATNCTLCDGINYYQSLYGQTSCKSCMNSSVCMSTQFLSGICSSSASPVCSSCNPTCLSCNGSSSNNCTSCSSLLNYRNGACVSSCALTEYVDTSHVCHPCLPPCIGCTGTATTCTVCNNTAQVSTSLSLSAQTFLLNSNCTSSCDQIGYYKNNVANQSTSGQCVLCSQCGSGYYAATACSSFAVRHTVFIV